MFSVAALESSGYNHHFKLPHFRTSITTRAQGLRTELGKQKEDIDRLEVEAVEMKERLKKLAKLEKNEKGHNAMTEELKRMEEETGLSVSAFGSQSQVFSKWRTAYAGNEVSVYLGK